MPVGSELNHPKCGMAKGVDHIIFKLVIGKFDCKSLGFCQIFFNPT